MADYSWVGPVVQGGVSLLGEQQAGKRDKQAEELLRAALARFDNIPPAVLEEIIAEQLGAPEAGEADPMLKAAQLSALSKLGQIEQSGGMTLENQAALNRVQSQLARQESAGRQSIANDMQARGMGGSGAELAMALQNQQASADRASQMGMDRAAMAQKSYLESILQRGQVAGNMRNQDFRERAARDEIEKYNAAARERANLHNAKLGQQRFDNDLSVAQGRAGLAGKSADQQAGMADSDRLMGAGLGAAAGTAADAYYREQAAKKKKEEEFGSGTGL